MKNVLCAGVLLLVATLTGCAAGGPDVRESDDPRRGRRERGVRQWCGRHPDRQHDRQPQDAVHLDLKPDNVIIKADGDVVLIDFGLAYHAHFPDLLAEEHRFAAGSAPYISPEQVLGTRSDPRSDIFALGAMLYEMTTGELPFGVPSTMAGK